MADGICKLTLEQGKFVQSHLIPKALTKPAEKGLPFVQAGNGTRPKRAWSSWYDSQLVTRAGEDILRDYDTWAIDELRQRKLVWSGWGPMQTLGQNHNPIPGTAWGVRTIECPDAARLRLFFMSLLWRAAASDRPEFSEVTMPEADLEALRIMVATGKPLPLSFYPIHLSQLSTFGPIHNQTPVAMVKRIPEFEELEEVEVPIFRFYFEGLIVHFHRTVDGIGMSGSFGSMIVGSGPKIMISTVTYEASLQRENLEQVVSEATHAWPHILGRT